MAGLVSAGTLVGAHHSYASFEKNRITLTGKVAAFAWTSPHVIIEIDGAEENGGLRRWTVELGSPGVLSRAGWKSSDLKFGDQLIVVVNPLRSGEAGGLLVEATLADGRVLGNGTPSAPHEQGVNRAWPSQLVPIHRTTRGRSRWIGVTCCVD